MSLLSFTFLPRHRKSGYLHTFSYVNRFELQVVDDTERKYDEFYTNYLDMFVEFFPGKVRVSNPEGYSYIYKTIRPIQVNRMKGWILDDEKRIWKLGYDRSINRIQVSIKYEDAIFFDDEDIFFISGGDVYGWTKKKDIPESLYITPVLMFSGVNASKFFIPVGVRAFIVFVLTKENKVRGITDFPEYLISASKIDLMTIPKLRDKLLSEGNFYHLHGHELDFYRIGVYQMKKTYPADDFGFLTMTREDGDYGYGEIVIRDDKIFFNDDHDSLDRLFPQYTLPKGARITLLGNIMTKSKRDKVTKI